MNLAQFFQRHATPEVWTRFSQIPELERALGELVDKGRHGFPQIALQTESFVAFLARHLSAETTDEKSLAALHGHELYLVCAYGLGDLAAGEILETQYFPAVRTALSRLSATEDMVEEIIQLLRHLLFAMQNPGDQSRGYSGRGNLAGWLRVAAVRMFGKRQQRERRQRTLDEAVVELLPPATPALDTDLLRNTYKEQFAAAFRHSVASLSSRQRNLLRYHFLDRLSIDQIAKIYGIHRATAARWIHSAQEELGQKTRAEFQRSVAISDSSVAGLLALIQSQLSLSLGAWLHNAAEPEETA